MIQPWRVDTRDDKVAMIEQIQDAVSGTEGVTEFTGETQSRETIYTLETEG